MEVQARYRVKHGKKYKKDVKRLLRSNIDIAPLDTAIEILRHGGTLHPRYRDHALKSSLAGTRVCHIGPDWLLHYAKDEQYLYLLLIGTGTHRNVLGIE